MARLLILTPGELTRDPRARRAALAAVARGLDVDGLCGEASTPAALPGVERILRVGEGRATLALRGAGLGGMRQERPLVRELRGIWRLGRLAATTLKLVRLGGTLSRCEIVHANDLDTLPAAWLLARRWKARLVYDAHEIYTAQEPDPPRLHRAATAWIEGELGRRCDSVTTVSEPIARHLDQALRLKRPALAVLNCPQADDTIPRPERHGGSLRVIYQGAMGPGRQLDDIFVAAAAGSGFELTVRVLGADRAELEAEVATRGLGDRVVVSDPVTPDRILEGLRGYDVGVIINRPVTLNDELVFPNKLFEYLMVGLAVAVPDLPGLEPFVTAERVGVTFPAGCSELLGEALTRLAAQPDELLALRTRAWEVARSRYNALAQAETMARAWGL